MEDFLSNVERLRFTGPRSLGHHNVRPPSRTRTWPVMNFECTRNKTASAISEGFAERRSGASLMKSVSHSGGSPGIVIVPGDPAKWETDFIKLAPLRRS